jgi:hypothetical protein
MTKQHNMNDKEKKNKFNKLMETLIAQYMSEGMSEFDARMKAIMSDESLAMVYPNGYDK